MIFDTAMARGSPAAESFCRRKNGGDDRSIKDSRRRRELRRLKLLDRAKAAEYPGISPDCDLGLRCNKRSKSDDDAGSEEAPRVDPPPRNDAASGGASTSRGGVSCEAHGSASVIGRRRVMEDAVTEETGFLTRGGRTYDFFGVYDGHGGCAVAQSCRETLHRVVARVAAEDAGEAVDWGKVMAAGFSEMDEEVSKNGESVWMVGSTAVVAVVGESELVVAHCGDSRAVVSRAGVAVQLSEDHKPDRADEMERIIGCGGKVIDWNGPRVQGVLATSRSIGDGYLKPYVTPQPEVKVINRSDVDEFLILASDGLWDVVSNELACQLARKYLIGPIKRTSIVPVVQYSKLGQVDETREENRAFVAATVLIELAMARGSTDNISVIVVDLRRSGEKSK